MKLSEQKEFLEYLYAFIKNGYSLQEAISYYNKIKSNSFSIECSHNLNNGELLYKTLEKYKFNTYVVKLISIGEEKLILEISITKAIDFIKFIEEKNNILFQKLFYPIVSFILLVLCFVFIEYKVYPSILLFSDNTSSVSDYAFLMYKFIVGIILFSFLIIKINSNISYKIPILKDIKSVQISVIITCLLQSGLSMQEVITYLMGSIKDDSKVIIEELERVFLYNEYSTKYIDKKLMDYILIGINTNTIQSSFELYYKTIFTLIKNNLNKYSIIIQIVIYLLIGVNVFSIYYVLINPLINIKF